MRLVVDEYPENCETCMFKTDDFARRQNFCNILHTHIGGVNDVRFDHKCYEHFILFKDLIQKGNDSMTLEEKYNKELNELEEAVEEFSSVLDKNPSAREVQTKNYTFKNANDVIFGNHQNNAKKRKTSDKVSIGDELRMIKNKVKEMDTNNHHKEDTLDDEDTRDKTLTKEQAAEMMCENFGGLV